MKKQTIITGAAATAIAGALALGGAALAQAGPSAGTQSIAQATSAPTATGEAQQAPGRGLGPGHAPGRVGKERVKEWIADHGLAGDAAVKVTQAAVAKEPTAYLLRVNKRDDGTYRAHMMRPDGTRIVVTIDANFSVTAVEDAPVKAPGLRKGAPGKDGTTATPAPTASS